MIGLLFASLGLIGGCLKIFVTLIDKLSILTSLRQIELTAAIWAAAEFM